MKVQMHSVHFTAHQSLLDFIQQRLNKLETFHQGITDGEVILRLNNKDGVDTNTVEIKVLVPGTTLFAQADGVSFEAATDAASESLRRQLTKYKEKNMSH